MNARHDHLPMATFPFGGVKDWSPGVGRESVDLGRTLVFER
jgi:hypothetical protein